eukprot:Unigene6480_Nuclearia_a/m.19950 Unigene6480_Nuclearia_a/g.19950  ORF Unigene6480_Nuclearia_a/g.19950 Unigene6480_Nuclearia_a/m.19950 type:complete len:301 (-) Unigene6480_Nuclearia_a:27-929(-)
MASDRVAPLVDRATLISSGLPNPGPFEQLQKESRDVFVTNFLFDGAKFDLSKMLSPTFQVTHRFVLGSSTQPQNFNYGAFVASNRGFIMGETDANFNLNGRFSSMVTEHLTCKGITQMNANGKAFIGEVEYSAGDQSTNFKLINPNLFEGTGVCTLSYLQSVTRRLVLGVEGTASLGPQRAINSSLAFVARLSTDNAVVNVNATTNGNLQLSYYQKVNEQISIASELEAGISSQQRDSIFTMGTKFDLRAATLRAQLDSTGKVAVVLEEKVNPAFSVLLSGELDHWKSTSRFGVGFNFGA